jgi:4-hydroxy-2-oxoheptanedioate aldolase
MSLKKRLYQGETVLGTWNIIPSAPLVEIIGYSGFDFVIIDAEHGPVGFEKAEELVRAAEGVGITPLMRVPDSTSQLVLHALDIGSHGVQVPHVSTEEEAEMVVEYALYHPLGQRGLSPFTRAGKYGKEAKNHTERSNERTLVVVNVEGIEGIKNLEKIAGVPGVDVVFIGPYDLSQSLGKPGNVEDQEVLGLIQKSCNALKASGKICGSFAKDEAYLKRLMEYGVQYITYMLDSDVILQAYKNAYKQFAAIKKG